MRVKMTRKEFGSPDGMYVMVFEKDEEYDVGEHPMTQGLADVFLASGAAKEVKTPPGPSETKTPFKPDTTK